MQTLCVWLPPATGRAFDLFQIYYTDLFRDKERLTMFPPYFTFQNHCESGTHLRAFSIVDTNTP